MTAIKLSKKQKEIIKRLQDGGALITDETSAWISNPKNQPQYKDERLSLRVFFNLIKKGLIWQNYYEHHDFTLTKLGKTIEL